MNLDAVIQLERTGDLAGAEQGYRSLISQNSDTEIALGNLAVICIRAGRLDEAIEHLHSALKLNPAKVLTHINLAVAYSAKGNSDQAVACHKEAVRLAPENAEVHYFLGNALRTQGKLDDAIASYKKAIELNKGYADPYLNIGNTLSQMGRLDDAIASYSIMVATFPQCPEGFNNLGLALLTRGRVDEAMANYRKAIEVRPTYAEAYSNLGLALCHRGKLKEAIECHQKAVQLKPRYYQGYLNLGLALQESHDLNGALAAYGKAAEVDPNAAIAYNNMGSVLQRQKRLTQAIEVFRKAVELKPNFPEAYSNMGIALHELERVEEAIEAHQKALEVKTANLGPDSPAVKLGTLLNQLMKMPSIYNHPDEVARCREHYMQCLNQASDVVAGLKSALTVEERNIVREVIFRITNFYLAYQQVNDAEVQSKYSRLVTEILRPEMSAYLSDKLAPRSGSKIRLGIASEYIKNHNGAFWAHGWLANLPEQDYELFIYSINGAVDSITDKFAKLGTYRWLTFREHNYLNALETIKQDNLDILIIPDVGMSIASKVLCLARLAPVQCIGWGHPTTCGSPNADYYLIGELMETEASDSHYSEKLIRLPNTGVYFEHPEVPAEVLSASDFGLPDNKIIYGVLQSLFKYLPQFDYVYPAIARLVPEAFFVFVGSDSQGTTAAFEARLRKAFEQEGLSFDQYVKILPRMPMPRFMQLLRVTDIYLDSIGFSGGITAVRALNLNCPIVTWPGEFMRSRLAYAMIKMIGVDQMVADNLDQYIALAAELGLNKKRRTSLKKKIKDNKHKLFHDMQCVEYLDQFFKQQTAISRQKASESPA